MPEQEHYQERVRWETEARYQAAPDAMAAEIEDLRAQVVELSPTPEDSIRMAASLSS